MHTQCVPCPLSVFFSMCCHISTLHYTHIQMSKSCPVVSVFLFNCYVVAVCHPCHTLHHITTLSSLSLLYITHHSACFTCYMYVHMHHANVCSVLHMLIVCLDHATHASSLHTCTVLVYHTYMYTHSIHCLSVVHHVPLFVRCYKTKNGSLVQAFHMRTVKRCYAQ